MALTLFARRPEPVEAPAPEPWPETGETWKPEGVTVVERYYNLGHAVVLVFLASGCHVVSCLGCHYQATKLKAHYSTMLTLDEAAELANTHAAGCRALPRDIPARPDEEASRELLRTTVRAMRKRDERVNFYLYLLDTQRLALQRTNEWIVGELERLAESRPSPAGSAVYTSAEPTVRAIGSSRTTPSTGSTRSWPSRRRPRTRPPSTTPTSPSCGTWTACTYNPASWKSTTASSATPSTWKAS
ncbi:hypothetical protein [Streptomyces sp. WM4235]|uniref:hypothetical protein n=1 Tax=Streptomyces sp. WM4235 TaxID=1415551 RepID=UPI0007C83FFC|nr:hypothetical protein [Streptomyces sp. WM4235]